MKFLLLFILCFGPLAAFADDAEDLNKEIQELQGNMQKMVQELQQKTGSIQGSQLAKAQGKIVELAADGRFTTALTQLWQHPNRSTLLWAELIFFLAMLFLKAWRQSKAKNWFTRILVGMFFSLVTWLGMSLVLPFVILGDPFRVLLLSLWKFILG